GPGITEPVVKISQELTQTTYFIPEGWDLADALDRLPSAFAAARPEVAHSLKRIEQATRDGGKGVDEFLDAVAVLILETGDPEGVYDQVLHLIRQVHAEQAVPTGHARAA
ncbi:hypothetical protein, partial [Streptomyces sp. bgisy100]|uniref:hypothetical protein n=1 Tax=Streptomyces sp. bgisy100 TaxID=3413783 RepID=UPI003D72DCF0